MQAFQKRKPLKCQFRFLLNRQLYVLFLTKSIWVFIYSMNWYMNLDVWMYLPMIAPTIRVDRDTEPNSFTFLIRSIILQLFALCSKICSNSYISSNLLYILEWIFVRLSNLLFPVSSATRKGRMKLNRWAVRDGERRSQWLLGKGTKKKKKKKMTSSVVRGVHVTVTELAAGGQSGSSCSSQYVYQTVKKNIAQRGSLVS